MKRHTLLRQIQRRHRWVSQCIYTCHCLVLPCFIICIGCIRLGKLASGDEQAGQFDVFEGQTVDVEDVACHSGG